MADKKEAQDLGFGPGGIEKSYKRSRMAQFGSTEVLLILGILIQLVEGNDYDPHIYPKTGPFFEGWYARLTDHTNFRSFGILFGRVLPQVSNSNSQLTYLALIRSNGSQHSMISKEYGPVVKDIYVTVKNGSIPVSNPDMSTPPEFQWVSKQNGFFNVTPTNTFFNMTINDIRFEGTFGKPVPWAEGGLGPEGWLHVFPLPLHWFVYSLATPGSYRWLNLTSKELLEGEGFLHQEKNWGNSFPPEWIWTEGYDPVQNVTYAGSFGTLYFGPLPVPAMLFGYRNYRRGLSINFRPDNSFATKVLKPCKGTASVTIQSVRYTVYVDISAPQSTFGTCLCGPKADGFSPVVTESFVSTTRIQVKEHLTWWDSAFRSGTVIEDVEIHGAALEFGGAYMCDNNPCTKKTTCG